MRVVEILNQKSEEGRNSNENTTINLKNIKLPCGNDDMVLNRPITETIRFTNLSQPLFLNGQHYHANKPYIPIMNLSTKKLPGCGTFLDERLAIFVIFFLGNHYLY